MQPESNESSPYTYNEIIPEQTNASQYGFSPEQLSPANQRGSLEELTGPAGSSRGNAAASDVGLQEQVRGLSVADSSLSKPKASFARISEYENALSPSAKKQSEGPAFKIVKKKGSNVDGIQLDQFPNGMPTSFPMTYLTF